MHISKKFFKKKEKKSSNEKLIKFIKNLKRIEKLNYHLILEKNLLIINYNITKRKRRKKKKKYSIIYKHK